MRLPETKKSNLALPAAQIDVARSARDHAGARRLFSFLTFEQLDLRGVLIPSIGFTDYIDIVWFHGIAT